MRPGQIDDSGACLECGLGNVGVIGLNGNQHTVVGQSFDHWDKRCDLTVHINDVRGIAGRLRSDIDHHSAFHGHAPGAGERAFEIVTDAFAIGRLGRKIDHAELVGFVLKGAIEPWKREGLDGMVDSTAIGTPQRQEIFWCDHLVLSFRLLCCRTRLRERLRRRGPVC